MELADLRAFARIAELSSISAAAQTLSLPKSSISRSLTRLEADIGAILVDRSTRHLRLTDAGILFRPHALRILADVDEAGNALDGFAGVPRGTLRVSMPFTFAVALVAPMLRSFLASYPEVRVVLDVENRIIDMPVEPADLVIRVGGLPDSDLIARHLMTTEVWTFASPAYLERHGTPVTVGDLDGYALIGGFDRPMIWSYRLPDGKPERIEFRPANVISDSAVLEGLLIGGGGIGRLPEFLARKSVASGHLVHLLSDTRGDTIDIHAIYASHRSLSAKVRVFIVAVHREQHCRIRYMKLVIDPRQRVNGGRRCVDIGRQITPQPQRSIIDFRGTLSEPKHWIIPSRNRQGRLANMEMAIMPA